MPTAGIKGKTPAGDKASSGNRNRNRNRRRSDRRSGDPLNGETLGEARKQGASIFEGEEEHDPFDIDLSAATYSEEDEMEETVEAAEVEASDEE